MPRLLALAALLLGATAMLAPARTTAAAGPTLAVTPASSNAVVGADVALDITVASVPASPGVAGFYVQLKWDPALLSLTSLAEADWIGSGDIYPVCTTIVDNGSGGAAADCTPALVFGDGLSTTAPQALVHAVFQAKAAGTTSIDLAGSYLKNPSNIEVAATLANGSVTVSPAPTSTPGPATATVAATDTPAASTTATATAVATSTATPAAAATSNVEANSTNAAGATLSNVEAPRTGSGNGSEGSNRTAWWIAGIAATAAAVTAGGAATYGWRWSRRRASGAEDDRQGRI